MTSGYCIRSWLMGWMEQGVHERERRERGRERTEGGTEREKNTEREWFLINGVLSTPKVMPRLNRTLITSKSLIHTEGGDLLGECLESKCDETTTLERETGRQTDRQTDSTFCQFRPGHQDSGLKQSLLITRVVDF